MYRRQSMNWAVRLRWPLTTCDSHHLVGNQVWPDWLCQGRKNKAIIISWLRLPTWSPDMTGIVIEEWRVDQRDDLTRSVYKSENYAGTWLTTYVMCMFSFSIELEYYNIIPSLCLNYIKCNLSEWLLYYGLLQSTNKPLISTLYIIWYFVCLNSRYVHSLHLNFQLISGYTLGVSLFAMN